MVTFSDNGSSVSISTCQTQDTASAFSTKKKTDKMTAETRLREQTEGWKK